MRGGCPSWCVGGAWERLGVPGPGHVCVWWSGAGREAPGRARGVLPCAGSAPVSHCARFSRRTERDASNWSTERLKTLLLPVRVESEEGACEVTEVSKLDGEASINNRKGKLIFFYEWAIKLAWTGE